MAALCPGVQYGLSTEENFSENKIVIFVKLTDSAYGTVQQHLKNQVSPFRTKLHRRNPIESVPELSQLDKSPYFNWLINLLLFNFASDLSAVAIFDVCARNRYLRRCDFDLFWVFLGDVKPCATSTYCTL